MCVLYLFYFWSCFPLANPRSITDTTHLALSPIPIPYDAWELFISFWSLNLTWRHMISSNILFSFYLILTLWSSISPILFISLVFLPIDFDRYVLIYSTICDRICFLDILHTPTHSHSHDTYLKVGEKVTKICYFSPPLLQNVSSYVKLVPERTIFPLYVGYFNLCVLA